MPIRLTARREPRRDIRTHAHQALLAHQSTHRGRARLPTKQRRVRTAREAAELTAATTVTRNGPLWRGTNGDRGFVTYRDLAAFTGHALDSLITRTITYYATQPDITSFEWKTRSFDRPADLPDRLTPHERVHLALCNLAAATGASRPLQQPNTRLPVTQPGEDAALTRLTIPRFLDVTRAA